VLLRVSRFHDGSSEASTQCHFTFHRNVTQKTASINVINCITTNQVLAFSALTLLVGRQEGHPACKKLEWWGAGVVICLEQGAD